MIKLTEPDIQPDDIARVTAVLQSGHLVQGTEVKLFEQGLCDFIQAPHCAMVASCTAALHLTLMALGIGPGDTVIVPAFTFAATANVVECLGADVLLCDVAPGSYVLEPQAVEALIAAHAPRPIKAIIVVHAFGYPVNMDAMAVLANRHRCALIEDAACALGSTANGKAPGVLSDAACFSFHPRKAVTSGEGGAVISRHAGLIEKINLLKNHGMQHLNGTLNFVGIGLNYRMTDIQAALAIGQLARFHAALEKRRAFSLLYARLLSHIPGVALPQDTEGHSWQSYMIVLDDAIGRDKLREQLLQEGIQSNLGAQAIHCLSYYRQKYDYQASGFPHALRLYQQGLVLPLHQRLCEDDIHIVSTTLKKLLAQYESWYDA